MIEFDLSALDAQDEGELVIKHPKTLEPTGWTWTFYGPGHAVTIELSNRVAGAALIRRARTTLGAADGGDRLPYVVRLSDPPTPHERLPLAACRLLRHPIAIVPATCLTAQEWSEKYSTSDRA